MANEYKVLTDEALDVLCGAIKNVAGMGEIIDDENVATDKTYSSLKIKEELDKVFTSVSSGKELVASAITDKGIDTPIDATFEEMADNISLIEGSGGVDGDLTPIHNAMESLGYSYTDLSNISAEETARLLLNLFELKPLNTNATTYISAEETFDISNWLIDGTIQDFGSALNPLFDKVVVEQTKNDVDGLVYSDEVGLELTLINLGGV